MSSAVEVGRVDAFLAIRVRGAGTWREAEALRKWVDSAVDEGTSGVVVDLAEAPHLDSTFVGTLVSIQRTLQRHQSGKVMLYGVGDDLHANLDELGIPVVVKDISGEPFPYDVTWHEISVSEPQQNVLTKNIIDAHELLMQIDESNVPRFTDAVGLLRQSLSEEDADGTEDKGPNDQDARR